MRKRGGWARGFTPSAPSTNKTWTPPPPRKAKTEQLVEVVRRGSRYTLTGPGIVIEADGEGPTAQVMFLQKGFPCDEVWSSNLRHCAVEDLSDQEMALLAEHRMSGKGAGEHDGDDLGAPF